MCKTNVIKTYQNLKKKLRKIKGKWTNLQREKEYELNKLDLAYETRIVEYLKQDKAISLEIKSVENYIESEALIKAD